MSKTYWKFFGTAFVVQMAQLVVYNILGIADAVTITPIISVAIGLYVAGVLK